MASSSYWNPESSSDEDDSEFDTPNAPSPHLSPRAIYGRHTHARSITTIRLPVQISDDDEDEPQLIMPDEQANDHSINQTISQSSHRPIHSQSVLAKPSLLASTTSARFPAPALAAALTATPPPLPARKSSFNARDTNSPLPLPKPFHSLSLTAAPAQNSRPSTPSDTPAESPTTLSTSSFSQTTPLRGVSFAGTEKSFASSLSSHFGALSAQGTAGSYTSKRIASLFKKVAELEEQFAIGLRKAVATEQSKLHRAQMNDKDHMSICCSAWAASQDQVAHLASMHAHNAQRTMEECVIPLLDQFAAQEERRKELIAEERRCLAELAKCQDDVMKQLTVCQNYIKQARTLAMDGDNINNPTDAQLTTEGSRPLIFKSLTKHFRASAKAVNQTTLKAAKSYSELINAANHRQQRYIQQEMPVIFNGMQDMEHARLALIKDKLRLYADAQISSLNQQLSIMNKVKQESNRMDPNRDIQSFIDICLASSPSHTQSHFPFTNATLGTLSGPTSGSSTPSSSAHTQFVYSLPYTLREIEDGRFMNATPNAQPAATPSSNMFGTTVESAMQAQALTHPDLPIPLIVHKCISIISQRGLKTEGIFRISIPSTELTQLKIDAQAGEYTALDAAQPHAAAALVKVWMRSLTEPIINESLYHQAMTLAQQPTFDGRDAQTIFNALPVTHQRIIDALAHLSLEISSHEADNRMTFGSLSIVFAPCLMHNPSQDPAKLLESSRWETKFVVALLQTRAQQLRGRNASVSAEQPISVDTIDWADSSDSTSVSRSERKW